MVLAVRNGVPVFEAGSPWALVEESPRVFVAGNCVRALARVVEYFDCIWEDKFVVFQIPVNPLLGSAELFLVICGKVVVSVLLLNPVCLVAWVVAVCASLLAPMEPTVPASVDRVFCLVALGVTLMRVLWEVLALWRSLLDGASSVA